MRSLCPNGAINAADDDDDDDNKNSITQFLSVHLVPWINSTGGLIIIVMIKPFSSIIDSRLVGSGRVQKVENISGSGQVTIFVGRVGSRNLDLRATLQIRQTIYSTRFGVRPFTQ